MSTRFTSKCFVCGMQSQQVKIIVIDRWILYHLTWNHPWSGNSNNFLITDRKPATCFNPLNVIFEHAQAAIDRWLWDNLWDMPRFSGSKPGFRADVPLKPGFRRWSFPWFVGISPEHPRTWRTVAMWRAQAQFRRYLEEFHTVDGNDLITTYLKMP